MTTIKKVLFTVMVTGGLLSMTSCGSIICDAYGSNELQTPTHNNIKVNRVERTPDWAVVTFADDVKNG